MRLRSTTTVIGGKIKLDGGTLTIQKPYVILRRHTNTKNIVHRDSIVKMPLIKFVAYPFFGALRPKYNQSEQSLRKVLL